MRVEGRIEAKKVSKRLAMARETFQRHTVHRFLGYGAEQPYPSTDRERLFLLTPVGKLDINVFENWIHTRFEDNERGYRATSRICQTHERSNPFSGKWNFLYIDNATTLEYLPLTDPFFDYIEKLLDWGRHLWQVKKTPAFLVPSVLSVPRGP